MKNMIGQTLLFVAILFSECSKEPIFNSDGTLTDTRDNNVYNWVKIGEQIWMAENLAYLPDVSPSTERSDLTRHYYVYDFEYSRVRDATVMYNYKRFGVLYNWKAAKNACPKGWHLPGDDEWTTLTDYLTNNGYGFGGSGDDIGKSMAAKSGWWLNLTAGTLGNDQASNNSCGFMAIPGGELIEVSSGPLNLTHTGRFRGSGSEAHFWSSTELGLSVAVARRLDSQNDLVFREENNRFQGFSVRCLKDQ
jgi:uncharacterized protein (TIGR02145 family)